MFFLKTEIKLSHSSRRMVDAGNSGSTHATGTYCIWISIVHIVSKRTIQEVFLLYRP